MPEDRPIELSGRGEVILPVSEEEFAKFIGTLLGKPQTIENVFPTPFDLEKSDIINCFHLVDQRVRQQNKATLVQFSVRINYDDSSSVLLNSLEAFETYREVKPLTSVSADLSWTYLIKFEDKEVAEKQVIELSISANNRLQYVVANSGFVFMRSTEFRRNGFVLRIQHTARTWGADIENLLAGQIRSWEKKDAPWKEFLRRFAGWIGMLTGLIFFVLLIWGYFAATSSMIADFRLAAEQALSGDSTSRLDFLIQASGHNPIIDRQNYIGLVIVFGLIASLILAAFVTSLGEEMPPSYLVLSEAAKRARTESKRERRWTIGYFLGSILISTASGVLSRYMFAAMFGSSL